MRISDWSSDVCSSDLVWVPIYGILKDRTCSKYIALHNNVDDATKPRRPGSPKNVLERTVMKKLVEILRANGGHWVGDGFPVRTMYTYSGATKAISPFLLFDYAGPHRFVPNAASSSETRLVGKKGVSKTKPR